MQGGLDTPFTEPKIIGSEVILDYRVIKEWDGNRFTFTVVEATGDKMSPAQLSAPSRYSLTEMAREFNRAFRKPVWVIDGNGSFIGEEPPVSTYIAKKVTRAEG
jgi:hypothetical protein